MSAFENYIGSKKLFIVALGFNFTETYANLETIFNYLNIKSLCGVVDYVFACDMKMYMLLLGKLISRKNSSTLL